MEPCEPVQQRRAADREGGDREQHAYRRGEAGPRQQIERQIEQDHRHDAEVDVVMPVVVGDVEQVVLPRRLLQLVARPAIVGVVHLLEPVGRLLLEVELALGHRFGELGVLLGVVAAHLEGVGDAVAVPRAAVIAARRHAHQVGAEEHVRADQEQLDHERRDDDALGELRMGVDADAVDRRLGAERASEQQDARRDQKPRHVELEGMARVEHHVVEADGVIDVVADHLDAQVVHHAARIEVEVLALRDEGGHLHLGHADGVLGRVEVGMVRVVGELDLDRDLLRGLAVVEVEPDVTHLHVEVGELDHGVGLGEQVGALRGCAAPGGR